MNTPVSYTGPFQIDSIVQQGNDMRLTWKTVGGRTNVLQASSLTADGSYTNSFNDLLIVTSTVSTLTNYLDVGVAHQFPGTLLPAASASLTGLQLHVLRRLNEPNAKGKSNGFSVTTRVLLRVVLLFVHLKTRDRFRFCFAWQRPLWDWCVSGGVKSESSCPPDSRLLT